MISTRLAQYKRQEEGCVEEARLLWGERPPSYLILV